MVLVQLSVLLVASSTSTSTAPGTGNLTVLLRIVYQHCCTKYWYHSKVELSVVPGQLPLSIGLPVPGNGTITLILVGLWLLVGPTSYSYLPVTPSLPSAAFPGHFLLSIHNFSIVFMFIHKKNRTYVRVLIIVMVPLVGPRTYQ